MSIDGTVRLQCDGRRGIHTGFVRDLSAGGMFLHIVDPEPPGTRLGFELWLPGMRFSVLGLGEVAWVRTSYEGPGRPPGMAVRFVALEEEAIGRLAALLPGEPPRVEVLERPPLPSPPPRPPPDPRVPLVAEQPAVSSVPAPIPGGSVPHVVAAATTSEPATDEAWSDTMAGAFAEPMIFVPPPPLPVPVLPDPLADPLVPASQPTVPSRLRWGSAAAGIAAAGALATLVVVGAARREGVPVAAEPAAETSQVVVQQLAAPPAAVPTAPSEPPAPETRPALETRPAPETPPAALPGPAQPPAPDEQGAAARRVTGVRWEPLAAGGTRIAIRVDGILGPGGWRVSRIGGDVPRLVVRLPGIEEVPTGAPWLIETAEVRRVRAGRHTGDGDGEVHLVLDLTGSGVHLAGSAMSADGELLLDLVPGP